jgi:hypothetical protein
MVFAEYSEISRRELFAVSRRFPDPRILVGWPDFRGLLENQNCLIRGLAEFRITLGGWHGRLADEAMALASIREELLRVAQFDLRGLQEQTGLARQAWVEASHAAEILRIIDRDRSEIDQFLFLDITFSDLARDRDKIAELRENLAGGLARIRAYLTRHHNTPESGRDRFTAIAAHMDRVASRSSVLLSVLHECESAARLFPATADFLCGRQTVLFQTVVRPSLDNLDATIEALRVMAAEKREKMGELQDAIRERRLEADRFEAVVACAKQKAKEPEGQCRDCEERRLFVLVKCGHSFCERCLNRLLESKHRVCPYSRCSLAFSDDDIMRINWES